MTKTYMAKQKKKSINSYCHEHLARRRSFLVATTQASKYLLDLNT